MQSTSLTPSTNTANCINDSVSSIDQIQDSILQLIENALLISSKNILTFALNLRNEILKKYSLATIEDTIQQICQKKTICFIRHGEAYHNTSAFLSRENKPNIFDSEITLKGIDQSLKIGKKLIKEMPNCSLILISSLKRAIQTFASFSNLYKDKANMKYIITDLIREPLTPYPKNIGMELSKLKAFVKDDLKLSQIDTSFITKSYWWTDDDVEVDKLKHNPEESIVFDWRLTVFIFWIVFRKENDICLISHSKVCKNISNAGIHNAKMKYISKEILIKRCIQFLTQKIVNWNK